MEYQNAEIRHSGNVIRLNVELYTYVPCTGPDAATHVWSGVLRPPNNTGLALGEAYTLHIPGYSPSKIVITSEASPHDGSVTFKGIGELPKSKQERQLQTVK